MPIFDEPLYINMVLLKYFLSWLKTPPIQWMCCSIMWGLVVSRRWIKMFLFQNGSKCWNPVIYFSFYKIIWKFTEFINYCRALEYEETPDYEHLRNMLKNRMKLKNYEFDKNFDWIENDPFQQVQSWPMVT